MLTSRYYIFIVCLIGLFFTSKASHNRAGEITYKWVGPGPYTYQIKVTTYTNIVPGTGGGGHYGGGGAYAGGGGGGSNFANGTATSVTHTQGGRTGSGIVIINYTQSFPAIAQTTGLG